MRSTLLRLFVIGCLNGCQVSAAYNNIKLYERLATTLISRQLHDLISRTIKHLLSTNYTKLTY